MNKTPLEDWIVEKTKIKSKNMRDIESYQLNKIISALQYAKTNSRFYKFMLKDFDIGKINSIEDIRKIPFTCSEDIKKNNYDFLCVPIKEIKRIVTINTSGTTGDGKRIFFTERDMEMTIDFFQYGMKSLTNENDKVLILLPGSAYGSIGDLLKKALKRSGIKAIIHGIMKNADDVEKSIIEKNITCIVGVPMQILYLSRMKSNVFKDYIKKVLLSTDYVPEILVRELKNLYNCDVYNHYGMTEMGYGGGVECESLSGYHMRECDMYFEIINPETGREVEIGEVGEVVFTTFERQAMPLIRYRTGDLAKFEYKECECGTFLRKMGKVEGRISNFVDIKNGGRLYLKYLDESILKFPEVLNYSAELKSENVLSICLSIKNSNLFDTVKKDIEDQINGDLNGKLKLEIKSMDEVDVPKVSNTMTKRIIKDFRKERIHERYL